MTKDKMKKVLTKVYGNGVEFSSSMSGRESASVPLSLEEREIASLGMSVGHHDNNGNWIEDAIARENKLDETRHVVALKDITTGEWYFTRDVECEILDEVINNII